MSTFKDVTEFVVKRSTWLRGEDGASLLTGDGRMCCLGFYAIGCGLSEKDILNQGSPSEVRNDDKDWESKLTTADPYANSEENDQATIYADTAACNDLMITNDDQRITNEERERKLTEKFAALGITVKFED